MADGEDTFWRWPTAPPCGDWGKAQSHEYTEYFRDIFSSLKFNKKEKAESVKEYCIHGKIMIKTGKAENLSVSVCD